MLETSTNGGSVRAFRFTPDGLTHRGAVQSLALRNWKPLASLVAHTREMGRFFG